MRNRLISGLAGTAFSFAASGLAFAADLNKPIYKAPPPPPPAPVYSWTGFYVGGNVGYGWGRASADVNYFAHAFGGPFTTVCNAPPFTAGALCINGSDTVNMNGVIGGVQAGYNWQNGNYLLGAEADFQGSGQRGTRDFAVSFNNGTAVGTVTQGTAAISIKERMPWFGTVRGRLGWLATPNLLFFGTGGLAYGRIEVDSSASTGAAPGPGFNTPTCSSPPLPTPTTCPVWGFSGSGVTKIGWAAGGGAELALGGNWTAKFEYFC